jgi:hypothetical protein
MLSIFVLLLFQCNQASTLDQTIKYVKSLQQQIAVPTQHTRLIFYCLTPPWVPDDDDKQVCHGCRNFRLGYHGARIKGSLPRPTCRWTAIDARCRPRGAGEWARLAGGGSWTASGSGHFPLCVFVSVGSTPCNHASGSAHAVSKCSTVTCYGACRPASAACRQEESNNWAWSSNMPAVFCFSCFGLHCLGLTCYAWQESKNPHTQICVGALGYKSVVCVFWEWALCVLEQGECRERRSYIPTIYILPVHAWRKTKWETSEVSNTWQDSGIRCIFVANQR